MVMLTQVWLPILLATLAIWVASTIVWMVLPWHKKDFAAFPDEEKVRTALKGLAPGQYNVPHCETRAAFKDPAFQRKMQEGPIALVTVHPSGPPKMGAQIVRWVLYIVFTMIIAAYVATRTVAPGESYLEVFRIVGVTTWAMYGIATFQEAIWFGRSWRMVLFQQADALIYAGLAAGVFGALWP